MLILSSKDNLLAPYAGCSIKVSKIRFLSSSSLTFCLLDLRYKDFLETENKLDKNVFVKPLTLEITISMICLFF